MVISGPYQDYHFDVFWFQILMINLDVAQLGAAGGDVGKRTTNALANPFENKGWDDTVANDGLIAMALGYKNTHYKGGDTNPAFKEEE